jgi:hypothetical protein
MGLAVGRGRVAAHCDTSHSNRRAIWEVRGRWIAERGESRENCGVRVRVRFAAFAAILALATVGAAAATAPPASAIEGGKAHEIPPPEARVDINRATVEELSKVPGMTASWAGRIVRFRPYRTKLDLMENGVVTSQVYERIKDYIVAHREKR